MTKNIFTKSVLNKFIALEPKGKTLINKIEMKLIPTFSPPFQQLVRAVTYQQISGKAAAAILGRFMDLVEMYLMHSLGRLDIISVKDLGVRKGYQKLYDLKETPTPGVLKKATQHWQPYGSVGTYLCWRILEL